MIIAYVEETVDHSQTVINSWNNPEEVPSVKSVEVSTGSAEIHKTHIHPPPFPISLAVSEPAHYWAAIVCVQSSDDGVIQQKSNRQRTSLSLHVFLQLCVSLLFLFSLFESWTNSCHWFGSLLVLFLDNQSCSLYVFWCKHWPELNYKTDP